MNALNITRFQNFFWRAIQMGFKDGVSFVFLLLTAKFLSSWEFGMYNYLIAIAFTLVIFSDFGISTATSKYVAEYVSLGNGKEKNVFVNAGVVIVFLSVVVLILVLFAQFFKPTQVGSLLLLVVPLLFLAPMSALLDGIYRGKKQFSYLSKITLVTGLISLIVGYFLIKFFGLKGAIFAQDFLYLSFFLGCLLGQLDFKFYIDLQLIKDIVKYSVLIGLANVSFFLFSRINVLIIGYFGFVVQVGSYEFVNKLLLMMLLPYLILSQVISPDVTSMYTKGDHGTLLKWYDRLIVLSFVTSTIVSAVLIVLIPFLGPFLSIKLLNPDTVYIFQLILITFISQSVSMVASIGFSTASGQAKLNLWFLLVFGVLNTCLAFYLTAMHGFIGAIYSNVFVKVLSDFIFVLYYRSKIKLLI